jgi:hypothetical protein
MSSISIALTNKLSESMKKDELKPGEYRGIEGMGSHYFSLSSTHDGKEHLFSAVVDGVTLYIFKVIAEEVETH